TLRAELAERLRACAEALERPDETAAGERLQELMREGNAELEKSALLLKIFHVRSAAETAYLAQAVSASYQAMLATAAWLVSEPAECPDAAMTAAAAAFREQAARLQAGTVPQARDEGCVVAAVPG